MDKSYNPIELREYSIFLDKMKRDAKKRQKKIKRKKLKGGGSRMDRDIELVANNLPLILTINLIDGGLRSALFLQRIKIIENGPLRGKIFIKIERDTIMIFSNSDRDLYNNQRSQIINHIKTSK